MSSLSDDQIELLKKLWADGWTASKIGAKLGVSRNTVIGRAHRMKLAKRPSPIKSRDPAATAEKRQRSIAGNSQHGGAAKRVAAVREAALRPAPSPVRTAAPVGVKPPRSFPVPLKASPFRTCQYLHGEAKLRNFCGAPTVAGHSYCAPHYIACHQKLEPVEQPAESEAA